MKSCLFLSWLLLVPFPVLAFSHSQACDSAALRAASDYGIPPQIMLAITRVETGRQIGGELRPWPWAVNQDGKSHWFENSRDATDFAQTAAADGQTNLDLGCFQLNLRWHGEFFTSIDQMFDPDLNADHAARFLVENHERQGNWVDAVAAYHSTTPEHAKAYIEKVEAVLQGLSDPGPMPDSEPPELGTVDKIPNQFPLLRPGTSGSLASLVPQSGAGQPLFASVP